MYSISTALWLLHAKLILDAELYRESPYNTCMPCLFVSVSQCCLHIVVKVCSILSIRIRRLIGTGLLHATINHNNVEIMLLIIFMWQSQVENKHYFTVSGLIQ